MWWYFNKSEFCSFLLFFCCFRSFWAESKRKMIGDVKKHNRWKKTDWRGFFRSAFVTGLWKMVSCSHYTLRLLLLTMAKWITNFTLPPLELLSCIISIIFGSKVFTFALEYVIIKSTCFQAINLDEKWKWTRSFDSRFCPLQPFMWLVAGIGQLFMAVTVEMNILKRKRYWIYWWL